MLCFLACLFLALPIDMLVCPCWCLFETAQGEIAWDHPEGELALGDAHLGIEVQHPDHERAAGRVPGEEHGHCHCDDHVGQQVVALPPGDPSPRDVVSIYLCSGAELTVLTADSDSTVLTSRRDVVPRTPLPAWFAARTTVLRI